MSNRGGRPSKVIDIANFEKLCEMQCTIMEIANFFNCSHDTIERFCKKKYKMTFREVFAEKRSAGLISLRRTQFALAEKNPTMAIFLGKQYLGQRDLIGPNNSTSDEDDPLTKAIKEAMSSDVVQ